MGGGDKTLKLLTGKTILHHVVERARPQITALILNANGDAGRFADFDAPVVPDVVDGFAGPLAGILTGMEWAAKNAPHCPWLASFAADAPFLPVDLVGRLRQAAEEASATLACARSDGRTHPVFGLWSVGLRGDLRRALVDEDMRKIDLWTARHALVHVDFAAIPVDPFFNINRPEDLDAAEAVARSISASNP
jgi:molybdenum cofactor guanylyltransferase